MRRPCAKRLQQASLQLGENLPLFGIITGFGNLTAQGKPLLTPGTQPLGRRAFLLDTRVQGLVRVPSF